MHPASGKSPISKNRINKFHRDTLLVSNSEKYIQHIQHRAKMGVIMIEEMLICTLSKVRFEQT
jgi:hypothetical protein